MKKQKTLKDKSPLKAQLHSVPLRTSEPIVSLFPILLGKPNINSKAMSYPSHSYFASPQLHSPPEFSQFTILAKLSQVKNTLPFLKTEFFHISEMSGDYIPEKSGHFPASSYSSNISTLARGIIALTPSLNSTSSTRATDSDSSFCSSGGSALTLPNWPK